MYEDRTQNYDPKIHEEYLIHDAPTLSHATSSFIAMCSADYSIAISYDELKGNSFLLCL